mmetsp:Transcript_27679/g.64920  ORF Transcript_27679/g.64920 Transcript_27679/m.64920 type:complete len:286 (-) Transcript_27679:585-1442(-)
MQTSEECHLGNAVKDDTVPALSTTSLDLLQIYCQRPVGVVGTKPNIRRRDARGGLLAGGPPEGLAKDLKVGNDDKSLQVMRRCLGPTGVARDDGIVLEPLRHVNVRQGLLVAFGIRINIEGGTAGCLVANIHHLGYDGQPLRPAATLRNIGRRQVLFAGWHLGSWNGGITVLVPIKLGAVRCSGGTDAAPTGKADAVRIALIVTTTAAAAPRSLASRFLRIIDRLARGSGWTFGQCRGIVAGATTTETGTGISISKTLLARGRKPPGRRPSFRRWSTRLATAASL